LHAATAAGAVVPVFVLDPWLLARTPARRQAFLFANLRALDGSLQRRGARLIVRTGPPARVLPEVGKEVAANKIFAEEDYTPYALRRDSSVAEACDLRLVPGQCVHAPNKVLKKDGSPYVVYTPYARAWKTRLPGRLTILPAPERINMPSGMASDGIPDADANQLFPAGEAEGHRRLQGFVQDGIFHYENRRNRVDLRGTSALSPYLRFGVLSMRMAVAATLEARSAASSTAARDGVEAWLNELVWREFYIQIMFHFPRVSRDSFKPHFSEIAWRNNLSEFERWRSGRTGVPIVDAGMRQLQQTGWMHNRARMIAASYLVKDLLINWQWGERWFMKNLIDGDPSANNGGWQWTAGTGTDAAPYFRIFNPTLQSKKFDPDGRYIRRWVPELATTPADSIHAPWEHGLTVPGYPARPVVDHAQAVRRTRLAYETARDSAVNERNP
jgi:deoxyribodipyrimidine photo-lyase